MRKSSLARRFATVHAVRRCAIVLAAGKGTRMRSDRAKVLHPLRGEPFGGDGVRTAVDGAFAADRSRIRFAEQGQQLGTGHAVTCALAQLDDRAGTAAILAGDVPLVRPATVRRLFEAAERSRAQLAFATFAPADPTGYGRVIREQDGRVVAIREHRDASAAERAIAECNAGLYAVDLSVLRRELPRLGAANAQGEIYLTDLVAACARTDAVVALEIDAVEAAGVNTLDQLAALERLASTR
jgi:bifunctional UDP-N-acetylglucosamine pyrophosphorylase/glucosamine-1-phosphate N-acetyltransferase